MDGDKEHAMGEKCGAEDVDSDWKPSRTHVGLKQGSAAGLTHQRREMKASMILSAINNGWRHSGRAAIFKNSNESDHERWEKGGERRGGEEEQ